MSGDDRIEATPSPLAAADVVRLVQLQPSAYAVEAELIGDDRIPPLHESEDDLRAAGLDWYVEQHEDGQIVGAVGVLLEDDVVDLGRLVVDPAHHRRGVGRRLVRRALDGAEGAVVSTGRDNRPARRL